MKRKVLYSRYTAMENSQHSYFVYDSKQNRKLKRQTRFELAVDRNRCILPLR